MTTVDVTLLGRYTLALDGRAGPDDGWGRRDGASLVKVLALAPDRRLHREQVLDLLWPDASLERAVPRLHKAAFHARRAAAHPDAVVLRDEVVLLFPGAEVIVDVHRFESIARGALAGHDPALGEDALRWWGGTLLPDDLYAPWAEERREQLRLRHLEVLRRAGRWAEVVELDPADDAAHPALIEGYARTADRHAALRQFDRLEAALWRALGVTPGPEARRLRDRLRSGTGTAAGAGAGRDTGTGAGPVNAVGETLGAPGVRCWRRRGALVARPPHPPGAARLTARRAA